MEERNFKPLEGHTVVIMIIFIISVCVASISDIMNIK